MTDAEIDRRAFSAKFELAGMAWKAAEDIGCMDEYIAISLTAWMRQEIIETFRRVRL